MEAVSVSSTATTVLTVIGVFSVLAIAAVLAGLGDCFKHKAKKSITGAINVDSLGPPPAKLGGGSGLMVDAGVPSLMKFKGMTSDGMMNNREAPETVANRGEFNPMSVNFSNINDFRGDKIKNSTRIQDDRAKSQNGGSGLMISPGLDDDEEEEEEEEESEENEEEAEEESEDGGFQGKADKEAAPIPPDRTTVKGRAGLPSVDPNTGTFRSASGGSRDAPPGMGILTPTNANVAPVATMLPVPMPTRNAPVPPTNPLPPRIGTPPKPKNVLEDDLEKGIKTYDPRVAAVRNAATADNGAILKSLNFTKETVQQSFLQYQQEEMEQQSQEPEEAPENGNSVADSGLHSRRKKVKKVKKVKKRRTAQPGENGLDGVERSKKKKKKKKPAAEETGDNDVQIEAI